MTNSRVVINFIFNLVFDRFYDRSFFRDGTCQRDASYERNDCVWEAELRCDLDYDYASEPINSYADDINDIDDDAVIIGRRR